VSKANPEGIRIGDTVRILEPKWIKRVGYPLHWQDLMEEAEESEAVQQAYRLLAGETPQSLWKTLKLPSYYLQTAAKLMVEARGFGGNERKIIYEKPEAWHSEACERGWVHARVCGKRTAYTGTRVAPAYGVSRDGEYWDDPGGLEDKQTHVLLMTNLGEIEAINVKLVTRTTMLTTQREVRRAFWEAHPTLSRHRIPNHSGEGKMYTTDTRCAFSDYVDHLSRNGEISQELAGRVTLS